MVNGSPADVQIAVCQAEALTEEERRWLDEMLREADWWPGGAPSRSYAYAAFRWRVLVRAEGRLVAHVGLGEREVAVDERPVRVGTVGGVMTHTAWQGRGLATSALQAAQAFIRDQLGTPFGLLSCGAHMLPFYRRRGWRELDAPVVFEQPAPGGTSQVELEAPYRVMVYPCTTTPWPAGRLDLRGLMI
ncbi:MAG TPA: GNAT family N-acetyltransferase [Chloroflexota bacterium]|jgi:GNAT superfamily N-acetyltransferase|nr:GNAT family N-acetyltransferase [Chloroflexota bacterium]